MTVDQFSRIDYLKAWAITCDELGITEQDQDQSLFNHDETYQDGEGI